MAPLDKPRSAISRCHGANSTAIRSRYTFERQSSSTHRSLTVRIQTLCSCRSFACPGAAWRLIQSANARLRSRSKAIKPGSRQISLSDAVRASTHENEGLGVLLGAVADEGASLVGAAPFHRETWSKRVTTSPFFTSTTTRHCVPTSQIDSKCASSGESPSNVTLEVGPMTLVPNFCPSTTPITVRDPDAHAVDHEQINKRNRTTQFISRQSGCARRTCSLFTTQTGLPDCKLSLPLGKTNVSAVDQACHLLDVSGSCRCSDPVLPPEP